MSGAGGLAEAYRGTVNAWKCDAFGHLNIAFYGERFVDAAEDLLERAAPGVAWRSRAIDTRYLKELRAGEGIAIRSGIIELGEAGLRLGHEAVNAATGERTTLVEHSLVPNADADWPELRERLRALVVPWSDAGFAPLALPEGDGAIPSGRDRIKPREADGSGSLSLLGYLRRFSDACLQVIDATGITEAYRRETRRGYATFETRLDLAPQAALAGEGIELTSAVVAIGNSSLRMRHRMRATRGGRLLASLYQAGVLFDLETRRPVPIPPELRARAAALLLGPG